MKKLNYKILKVMAFTVITLFMSSSVFAQVQESTQDTTAQDTTTQMNDQQQVTPQEQNQRTGDDMQSRHPDQGVNYSETIDKGELPQDVNSSLDELYPAHEIQEAFRGEDDSFKVKVKNETDEAVVYYDSEGKFLRAENLSGLQQEGALPQEQGQRTMESDDQDQYGTEDRQNSKDTVNKQQETQQQDWGTQEDDQDTMQNEDKADPQEQYQQTDESSRSQGPDKGVDYSESVQESDLPQEVTTSLDELYPAHEIQEIHQGDDDSYKVKVKNEDDIAVVYYDSEGDFLRAQNLSDMQQEASSQEQSQRAMGTNDFDSWDADNDNQLSETEFSDGLFSQGKNDAGLFDDDDKDSKGLSEIGAEGKNDSGIFDSDDKDSKGLSEIGAEGKNDSGIFDSDDKDSKGLSEIGSDIGYDDDTFYETSYYWWDENNDQRLDENEWNVGYENSYGDYLDDDFDAYDTNQDSYLSYDEYYDSVYETDYFADWDSNNDDILDNDEYSAGIFDTWDANDDNYIDENEYNELDLVIIDFRTQQNQNKGKAYPQEQSQRSGEADGKDEQQQTSPQEMNQRIEDVEESQDADRWGTDQRTPDYESGQEAKQRSWETDTTDMDTQSDTLKNESSAYPQEQNQQTKGNQDEERFEDNWGPEDMGAHQSTWKDGEGYPQEQNQQVTEDELEEVDADHSTWMGGEGTDTTTTPSRIDTTAVYKNQWEEGTFEEGDDTASPQEQNQQATDDDELEDQSTWMGGEGTDTTSTPSRVDTTAVYNNQWEEDTFEEGDDTTTPQEQYQQTDEWGDADTTDMQGEYGTTPTDTTDTSYNDQMMEDNTLDGDDTASPQEQYQATGGSDDVDYSEEIQENELPESITSSIDDMYPDYEIEEVYRGDDDSYKVKIKKNEEKIAVYYDSDGIFYRDEVLDDILEDTNKDTNQDW